MHVILFVHGLVGQGGSVDHFLVLIGALLLGVGLVLVAVGLSTFFRPGKDDSDSVKLISVGAAVAGLGTAMYALNK